ncbi:MAG: InlB B-repeat-containing protein, partial [Clostridiales bacterium]|nr:InlB B-repeat-containing protein [Clostridiales bacterium]
TENADGSGKAYGYGSGQTREITLTKNCSTKTLYAQYKAKEYTVSFKTAIGDKPNDQTVTYGETYGSEFPDAPYHSDGYNFFGWNTQRDGKGATITSSSEVKTAKCHTLYAIWEYTLTYDTQGGNIATHSEVVRRYDKDYEFTIVDNEPSKSGYTFAGWSREKGGAKYESTTIVVPNTTTLYALWDEKEYTLKYDTQDAAIQNPADQNEKAAAESHTFTIEAANPIKTGYDFIGWSLTKTSDQETLPQQGGEIAATGKITTVYAIFRQKTLKVKFETAIGDRPNDQTVTYGETYGDGILGAPEGSDGYKFFGWSTQKEGKVNIVKGDTVVKATQDHTLYAIWEYTLTYDTHGGNIATHSEVVRRYDKDYEFTITSRVPTKTDDTFAGWSLSENGAKYESTTIVVPNTTTLHALWTKKVYTLTYDYNGGIQDGQAKSIVTGESKEGKCKFTIQSTVPTKEGYTFVRWDTEQDGEGGQTYLPNGEITLTCELPAETLYAQWAENEYKVEFITKYGTAPNGIPVTYGKEYAFRGGFPDSLPTVENHAFLEWRLELGNPAAKVTGKTVVTTAGDHKLHAVWNNTYNLTFDNNGGTSAAPQPIQSITNQLDAAVFTIEAQLPTREGFVFAGWNTKADGNGSTTQQGAQISVSKANTTLYALWQSEQLYTVTYTDGVDSAVIFKDQVTSGLKATDKTPKFNGTPKRSGYKFAGWSPLVTEYVKVTAARALQADINIVYTAKWTKVSGGTTVTDTDVPKTGDWSMTWQMALILSIALLSMSLISGGAYLKERKKNR